MPGESPAHKQTESLLYGKSCTHRATSKPSLSQVVQTKVAEEKKYEKGLISDEENIIIFFCGKTTELRKISNMPSL